MAETDISQPAPVKLRCELGFYANLYKLHAMRITNAPDRIIDLAQDASFDTCANQIANDLAGIILMAQIQQFVFPTPCVTEQPPPAEVPRC